MPLPESGSKEAIELWENQLKKGVGKEVDPKTLQEAEKNTKQLIEEYNKRKAAGEPNRADILRAEEAKIMKDREGREKGDSWQDAEKERN